MHPDRALAFDRRLSAALATAAVLAALTLTDAYLLRLLAIAGCYAILAIGYQRIFGELGVLSLAQGAFFAIGGYAMAILGLRTGLDGLLLLPAAIALAILLAVLTAPPLLKLASHYFALASLAIAQLVLLAAINLEYLTGGANGLTELPPLRLAGIGIEAGWPLTLTIWTFVALCAVAFWLPGSLTSLRRHIMRDAPLAAQAMGLNAARWRAAAFAFAAGCGGLAGSLYVPATGVVAPDIAELAIMINVLAMTVIGGRGRVAGAIVGALILAFLPEFLRLLGGWQLFAWGLAMLLMLILAPGGLVGLLERYAFPLRRLPHVSGDAAALPTPAPSVLHARGLRKSFGGVIAVDDVSMQVASNEIVGIIGPNGAGKTTLINLLSGFERPEAGQIVWQDNDIVRLDVHERARRGIGRSFQIDQLPGDIMAVDAVAAGVRNARNLSAARQRAMGILQSMTADEIGRTALAALPPATRRLVDIARAVAAAPSLLLLDEPTSGLGSDERRELANKLRALRSSGLGLLIVEHDIEFLLGLADRLVCFERGLIVASGPPGDLIRRPELAAFFGRSARKS